MKKLKEAINNLKKVVKEAQAVLELSTSEEKALAAKLKNNRGKAIKVGSRTIKVGDSITLKGPIAGLAKKVSVVFIDFKKPDTIFIYYPDDDVYLEDDVDNIA